MTQIRKIDNKKKSEANFDNLERIFFDTGSDKKINL